MYEVERIIHEQYKDRRMRGEWFMLTDTELETVKEDMVIVKDYDYSQSRPGMSAASSSVSARSNHRLNFSAPLVPAFVRSTTRMS